MGKTLNFMRLENCNVCSNIIYPGFGMTFYSNHGQVFRFCRSKCNRLFKTTTGENKKRWVMLKTKRNHAGILLNTMGAFERETKRPLRRTVLQQTIEAIKKLDVIRRARVHRHYFLRLRYLGKMQTKLCKVSTN